MAVSKRINAAKLKAMGLEQTRRTCVHHATRASEYKQSGNTRMFEAHCALLDQCAGVGRQLIREQKVSR